MVGSVFLFLVWDHTPQCSWVTFGSAQDRIQVKTYGIEIGLAACNANELLAGL